MLVVRRFPHFSICMPSIAKSCLTICSEILDMSIVVLAAVAIFLPLPMDILGNKYEIHQYSLAQMMLLDLPAWGISCVCIGRLSEQSPPLPPLQTTPCAETNWSKNCMPDLWSVPETPLCSTSKSKERVWHRNRFPCTHDIEVKEQSPLPWLASLGKSGCGWIAKA